MCALSTFSNAERYFDTAFVPCIVTAVTAKKRYGLQIAFTQHACVTEDVLSDAELENAELNARELSLLNFKFAASRLHAPRGATLQKRVWRKGERVQIAWRRNASQPITWWYGEVQHETQGPLVHCKYEMQDCVAFGFAQEMLVPKECIRVAPEALTAVHRAQEAVMMFICIAR